MGRLLDAFEKARKQKDATSQDNPLMPLGDILNQGIPRPAWPQLAVTSGPLKTLSRVRVRLLEPPPEDDALSFQHSVFCQTALPYRQKDADAPVWERRQGNVSLEIQAGRWPNPITKKYDDAGLPYGTKPRLILAHLNAEALRQASPNIEIEVSLSAFVRRIQGSDGNGREIKLFTEQLRRLTAATFRLTEFGERTRGVQTQIINAFDLWLEKDARQRVLWPSTIRLSTEYFASLQHHAVPLNESDLAALSYTAMGLDIYCWLAQRLHRVDPKRPQFIPWTALKEQFGHGYRRMDTFKRFFRHTLGLVRERYRTARIELDNKGMTARKSPPPVAKRLILVNNP
jgi:hypothetical protein